MRLTKSPLSRYVLPIITVGSALGLTIVLKSLHWPHPFTFYFLAAIAVTFWFGGTGPGVFSLILASIVFNFVFTPPPGSDSSRLYYVINFVIVALLIAWVSASRRRAENLLDQARGELEIKVNERTASLRRANEELSGEVAERKKAEQALRASDQVTRGQAEALIHSLDVLASAPAPEKFLGQMLKTIGRLLKGQSVALWLLDDATDGLILRGAVQGGIPAGAEANHPFVENGSGWRDDARLQQMFRLGLPTVYDGVGDSPREKALREYFLSKGTKTCLMVPTLVGGDVKGFISIRHGDRDAYRPEEIELAQAFGAPGDARDSTDRVCRAEPAGCRARRSAIEWRAIFTIRLRRVSRA